MCERGRESVRGVERKISILSLLLSLASSLFPISLPVGEDGSSPLSLSLSLFALFLCLSLSLSLSSSSLLSLRSRSLRLLFSLSPLYLNARYSRFSLLIRQYFIAWRMQAKTRHWTDFEVVLRDMQRHSILLYMYYLLERSQNLSRTCTNHI